MPRKKPAKPRATKGKAGMEARYRLFASAYIANGGNGREAARTAGYTGSGPTLDTQASRMLRQPKVKALLEARLDRVERSMKTDEIVRRLSDLARMSDREPFVDAFEFITLTGVASVQAPQGATVEQAMDAVKKAGSQNQGFYIDLEKAKAAGLGRFIREVSHDAETGAPRLKLQDNLVVLRLAKDALAELATIRGLKRDKVPPPPAPPNVTVNHFLMSMPLPLLKAIHEVMEAGMRQQKTISVTAKEAK
jgi:phage terminase small subunit